MKSRVTQNKGIYEYSLVYVMFVRCWFRVGVISWLRKL